jgi:hypothetical protein
MGKMLSQRFNVFPGSKRRWKTGPLDQSLQMNISAG